MASDSDSKSGAASDVAGTEPEGSTEPQAAAEAKGDGTDSASQEPAVTNPLRLSQVLESVETQLPVLLAAMQEIERAEGALLAAQGGFDPVLKGKGQFDVAGFYESERGDIEIDQPTALWGASFFSGYRIGRGDFAIYDGKDKTNEAGEARIGARFPLFQGRDIDKRRAALWKARIARDRADPLVHAKRLLLLRKAALVYWKWRAAGEKLRIVRELLELARARRTSLDDRVREGLLPEINLIDNERLVVEREALEVAAIRMFEKASFALSLFFRDSSGEPVRPTMERLQKGFPEAELPEEATNDLSLAIEAALANRPEIRGLELDIGEAEVERRWQRNRRLPQLDVEVFASQDLGGASSSSRDKTPFEVGAGVFLKYPLYQRDARGRQRIAEAKIAKTKQILRSTRDRIGAEVRDASSAVRRASQRIRAANRAVSLATQMEEAERTSLELGNSDILRVNLREDRRAKDVSIWIEAQADFFAALAAFRVAIGEPPAIFE
ncbi:MAG: TolC family protein [Planctomycetota bacterium]